MYIINCGLLPAEQSRLDVSKSSCSEKSIKESCENHSRLIDRGFLTMITFYSRFQICVRVIELVLHHKSRLWKSRRK